MNKNKASSHARNETSRSRPATTTKARQRRKSPRHLKSDHKCGKPIRRVNSTPRFCKRRAAKVIFSSRKGWIGFCDQHATQLLRLFPAAAGAIMTILP